MNLFLLVCIFAFLMFELSAQKCPDLYKRYSVDHTYCKPPNQECKKNMKSSGVSAKDIEDILAEHNALRNKIATGNEKGLPTASNMLQMVWDDELAAVAQKHAEQCKFEHDCNTCRRVQNFEVGQNLATGMFSGSTSAITPEWKHTVRSWYDEVKYFNKKYIEPFVPSPAGPKTYGHFSQVVWAESWRVGCGYTLYTKDGNMVTLYTCNYGPGGNMKSASMYKQGSVCSECPDNSCCGKTCKGGAEYPGLCKITDNKAPAYKPKQTYLFYCDFGKQSDCNVKVEGANRWTTYNTLSGNFMSIMLKSGEQSTLTFTNAIKPTTSTFCVVTLYRKGPNVDGQEESSSAIQTYQIVGDNFNVMKDLPPSSSQFRQQFKEFKITLSWNMQTQVKVAFHVSVGKPVQFFEISKIYATDGKC